MMDTSGISEATQVINVAINGSATALRLAGSLVHFTGHELLKLAKLIMARIKEAKLGPETLSAGEHNLGDLIKASNKNNESIGAMAIPDSMMDEFVEFAKQNRIAYSQMFKLEGSNERTLVYKQSDAWAYQTFILQHREARVTSFEDYLRSATTKDMINADHINTLNEYSAHLKEVNTPKGVVIDKSQIVGQTQDSIEVCVNNEDGLGFVKVPRSALKHDSETGIFALALADSFKGKLSKEPSIVKDESGATIEKIVEGTDIRGDKLRSNASLRCLDVQKGRNGSKKTFINPDVNVSKTVDTAAKTMKNVDTVTQAVKKVR